MSAPTQMPEVPSWEKINYLELVSPYVYTPSLAAAVVYIAIFSLITAVHVFLGIRYRYRSVFYALIPGGILEILGWSGRLWSNRTVLNSDPFIMQMVCLIIGPVFFSAWCYTVLGFCITSLGPVYSALTPKMYIILFVIGDVICLVVQAVGGAMAAETSKAGEDSHPGTMIMLAGVVLQMVVMLVFTILAVDFMVRLIARRPHAFRMKSLNTHQQLVSSNTKAVSPSSSIRHLSNPDVVDKHYLRKAQWLLFGEAIATAMIFIRGVFRTIELAQGWEGRLMTHEPYFIYLDGVPLVICYLAFALFHPGFLLKRES